MIDSLTNAVRVLGLSDELNIDYPKVRRYFINKVRSVHPDKNDGIDSGFGLIIEAYRLLDYYFNVVVTGKNCPYCNLDVSEGTTCHDRKHVNTHETCFSMDSRLVDNLEVNDPLCILEHCKIYNKYPLNGLNYEFDNICKKHSLLYPIPGRFYSNISRESIERLEGSNYVQCRCGHNILVTLEAMALGILTFDCDVCSCTYRIVDAE